MPKANSNKKSTCTPNCWYVYIIRCADKTLYTGITTNVTRRMQQHNAQGKLAAKYLRGKLPLTLVFQVADQSKSNSDKEQERIKKLPKTEKEILIASMSLQ